MSSRTTFPPKLVGEVINLNFDFVSHLAVTETISTQSVTATVYSGVDVSPSSLVNGSATVSGTIVTQSITGGVAGVTYNLVCNITTSLSQTLDMTAMLSVLPNSI